jgi:hypothetical protein
MAKKKQPRSKSRPAAKRAASHPFMTTRENDLSALFSAAGKGPHKDQVSTRLATPDPGGGKPGSRED